MSMVILQKKEWEKEDTKAREVIRMKIERLHARAVAALRTRFLLSYEKHGKDIMLITPLAVEEAV